LDAAFPGQIQPELLRAYRQIYRLWHYWLGFDIDEDKPDVEMNEDTRRKRMQLVNATAQTTPSASPTND